MRVQSFLYVLIIMAVAALIPARAETPSSQPRIAFVHSGIPTDQFTATSGVPWIREFFQELRRLGYADGQNLVVERYSAEGHLDRFPELARKIAASNPVVIVSNGPLVNALRAATTTIPVLAIMGDPIREGVTSNLAAPPANISGVSVDAGAELYGKQLQILKEAVPAASTVAYLSSQTDWDTALGEAVRDSGERLGVSVMGMPVKEANAPQFREVFAQITQPGINGLIVSPSGEFLAKRGLIVELAADNRLPAIYPYRDFVEGGGLMAYAPDLPELARHLADQTRKVLQGRKIAEIPIYQATIFKLIINLKTAKSLGLTIPQPLLARADEVIE
jgi:ABC-type uncharacterized transport system substrate-binding protein